MKPKKKYWDDDKQNQSQSEKQAQAQAELQAQLQGQAQGQHQGQNQYQTAAQDLYQKSSSKNENDNDNYNKSYNKSENDNDNNNYNRNENKLDNYVDNDVHSDVDNDVNNYVKNHVDVKVDVDLGLNLDSYDLPSDDDLIDMKYVDLSDLNGAFSASTDDVYQSVSTGNAFNIDQVNTMVDNDYIGNASVSYDAGGGYGSAPAKMGYYGHPDSDGFSQWASADGGKAEYVSPEFGDQANLADSAIGTADAAINQEAFTQNIVMGANVQLNSFETTVAGNDIDTDIL